MLKGLALNIVKLLAHRAGLAGAPPVSPAAKCNSSPLDGGEAICRIFTPIIENGYIQELKGGSC
jgi:hypothetical protein